MVLPEGLSRRGFSDVIVAAELGLTGLPHNETNVMLLGVTQVVLVEQGIHLLTQSRLQDAYEQLVRQDENRVYWKEAGEGYVTRKIYEEVGRYADGHDDWAGDAFEKVFFLCRTLWWMSNADNPEESWGIRFDPLIERLVATCAPKDRAVLPDLSPEVVDMLRWVRIGALAMGLDKDDPYNVWNATNDLVCLVGTRAGRTLKGEQIVRIMSSARQGRDKLSEDWGRKLRKQVARASILIGKQFPHEARSTRSKRVNALVSMLHLLALDEIDLGDAQIAAMVPWLTPDLCDWGESG